MGIHRECPLVQRIDHFLYSPAYLLFIGGLTILANIFCLEMVSYTAILVTAVYICLFARDILPLFPMFACGYISPSMGNNPGLNSESIFSFRNGGLYLSILLGVVIICLFYRLITDPDFGGKQFWTKKRRLLPGMLLLGAAYVLSGVASGQWEEYGWRNLFFAIAQFGAIAFLYFLLSGGVRWDHAPKAYLFWTGICVGYVLLAELINIYIVNRVIEDGCIMRERIYTGWGHYNNIGAMLAMMIPLPFFLTGKGRYAWFAYFSAFLFCIGLLFTCSRGSILVGVPICAATYILSLVHSRHARSIRWVHIIVIGVPLLMLIFFHSELSRLFKVLPELGFDSWQRMETYVEGFKQFLKFPIFGGSFFPVDFWPYAWGNAPVYTALFPPRWHNTLVQLVATGGITCFAAYVYHRVQTFGLFTKNFSTEKLFAGLSITALLLTSMVDCHMFNIGPVLFYSATLAIVEFQLNKK